jgi:hypothetical protein
VRGDRGAGKAIEGGATTMTITEQFAAALGMRWKLVPIEEGQ